MAIQDNQNAKYNSWPVIYSDVLELGDPESNVAICSLWTHRKATARRFSRSDYAVIGNLHGSSGISPMIRNICTNPRIRYLILWGNDLSDSGDALVEFMREGVNSDRRTPSGRVRIDPEIDVRTIDLLRANVLLYDLRGETFEKVKEIMNNLPQQPPFSQPIYFPASSMQNPENYKDSYPSELSGFKVSRKYISQAWLEILYMVMRFGIVKLGKIQNWREIINMIAVITDEDSYNELLPPYMQLTKDQLEQYYPQILTPMEFEGTSYTYGNRLRKYNEVDQIEVIKETLRQKPYSKRMFATTWKVESDTFSGDSPCLTQINGLVRDDKFLLTAHFRAQDMFGAWRLNTFAMRRLQFEIAKSADMAIGPLTIITHSAHIFHWNWDDAVQLTHQYKKNKHPSIEMDPRGYIIISAKDTLIEAVLHDYDNNIIDVVSGSTARRVGTEITRRKWYSDPEHALYLGGELVKAEIALRMGVSYIQDSTLDIS